MSAPAGWADALAEPLRSIAASGRFRRIEESREGGWILLADAVPADVDWSHLPSEGGVPVPLDPLADERLPELRRSVVEALRRGERIELLAWRVGSRAVLRVESGAAAGEDLAAPAAPGNARIVKVYRKGRALAERWSALAPSGDGRWRAPRVLAFDPERRRLELELCRGVSLHRRWLAGEGSARDADRIAEILRWLAATPLPDRVPPHDTAEEVRVLEERIPVFERTLADPPAAARPLVERVVAALRALPEVPPVLCHRDLHDKQAIIDGDAANGPGALIDLDLAAAGHPALDVGNILAHARLRALKGAALPWSEIAGEVAEAARLDRDVGDALGAWTASPLLRLALIYSRRAHRPGLIPALLDSAAAALAGGGEWREIL